MSKLALPKFPSSFLLLQQEGYLISSCLGTGPTEFRNAHVHNKDAFYIALFNPSIGIERLLKAIVIIDHMLNNSLSVPTKKQLKSYGHNIVQLYNTCEKIGIKRQCPNQVTLILTQQIKRFYYSSVTSHAQPDITLDALSASQSGLDPLHHEPRKSHEHQRTHRTHLQRAWRPV